jgi:hypothetical protein
MLERVKGKQLVTRVLGGNVKWPDYIARFHIFRGG